MFILEANKVNSAMYAKGLKTPHRYRVMADKRIGYIKLKGMQSKGVVIGLLTFKEKEIEGVC